MRLLPDQPAARHGNPPRAAPGASEVGGSVLALIFAACHPALGAEARITLITNEPYSLYNRIALPPFLKRRIAQSKVTIKRVDKTTGKELKIEVNLKKIIQGKTPDIRLAEGDVIIVPESIIG